MSRGGWIDIRGRYLRGEIKALKINLVCSLR